MDVSFVIPVFNNANRLKDCLTAIFSQNTEVRYEVIVVDNGSSDDSLMVASSFPVVALQVLNLQSPYACRNRGFQLARGKIVIFLDSNVVIQNDDWLSFLESEVQNRDFDVLVPQYIFDVSAAVPTVAEFVNSFLFLDSKKDSENGGGAGPCLICKHDVFLRFGEFPTRRSNGDTVWTQSLSSRGGKIVWAGKLVCRYPAKSEIALRKTQMRIGYGNRLVWLESDHSHARILLRALWNMRPMSFGRIRSLILHRDVSRPESIPEFSVWLCVWRMRIYRGLGRMGFKRFLGVVAD